LAGELVTGEGEDVEALIAELFLKRAQTCVLRREASRARYVDDQADLVLKLGEGHLVTGDRLHLEICECHARTISAEAQSQSHETLLCTAMRVVFDATLSRSAGPAR
jgi:hypothetical protein